MFNCFLRRNINTEIHLTALLIEKRGVIHSKLEALSCLDVKGVRSWFAHLEKFNLNVSSSSFVICVNLLHS